MDISKMSNFKNPNDFFVKNPAIFKLEHVVGNSSTPYKYFCDDDFFGLKKVNRTFLDIF